MNIETKALLSTLPATACKPFFAEPPGFYVSKVRSLYVLLSKCWPNFADIVGTLLIEPHSGFRAGYLMYIKGLAERNITYLNPRKLTVEQCSISPVLFIHGDSSKSGIWEHVIEKVAQINPLKPIFAVDLKAPDGRVTVERHLPILVNKVKEIKTLYPLATLTRVSLVGHSSGGDIIGSLVRALSAENISTDALIKIGSYFKEDEIAEFSQYTNGLVLEILGTKDIIVGNRSTFPNQMHVISGHVSLLFHPAVTKRVANALS